MPKIYKHIRATTEPTAGSWAALLDRPLIWLLPFYMGGIRLGWDHPTDSPWPLVVCAALALAAAFADRLPGFLRERAFWLLIPAVTALGWGLTSRSLIPPGGDGHLINYTAEAGFDRQIVLGGVVLEGSGWRPGRNHRFIIEAREMIIPGREGPESVQPVRGKVRVTVGGGDRVRIEVGDYVRMPLMLRRVQGFKNPGTDGFDKYWGARGVWVDGWVKSPLLITSWASADSSFFSRLSQWRGRAAQFISRETPEPVAGLLAAQLAGRRSAVDTDTEEVYRALGLSHLLSVSGLHLGVWYGLCFWAARRILRRVRPLAARVGTLAGALALVPALAYAMLAGSDSPVVRSAVMIAAVVLAAVALKRSDPWNILAVAAWALLAAEPYRLFTASFQLSFAATAAMLAVFLPRPGGWSPPSAPPNFWFRAADGELLRDIYLRFTRGHPIPAEPLRVPHQPRTRPGSFFRNTLLAALAGTLGAAPLIVWHFGRLPLAGIPANMLFTPLLSALVLIPGLVAMALLPLSPALAAWPLALAAGVQAGLLPLMESLAQSAGRGWLLPAPGPWFLSAWFLAGWIWLRGGRPWKSRLALASAVLAAGLLPGLAVGQGDRGVMRFTVLDIGQGSAIHINFPDGSQMLVDGGGTYNSDPGELIVTPYLLRQGISRLDAAVLTHPDRDHLKGLLTATENFRPREVWDAPWPEDYSSLYQKFREITPDEVRIDLSALYEGRHFGGALVRLLWPPPELIRPDEPSDQWVNAHGLVLRVQWGEASFLITGDIEADTEKALAERYGRDLKTTVLIAPHHGGRGTLSTVFLKAADPEWVVFSSGRLNSYGHPLPETLKRAEAHGARIRRTDLEGAAVFEVREKGGRTELEVRPPL